MRHVVGAFYANTYSLMSILLYLKDRVQVVIEVTISGLI